MREKSPKGKHRRPRRAQIARRAGTPALAACVAAGMVATGATTASAAARHPVAPRSAPAFVESYSTYLPQVSCDPIAKPGTLALRALLLSTYGGRDLGITRACGVGGLSEHKEGRAWDWGLSAKKSADLAIANRFLRWLLASGPGRNNSGYNARRLGVMYVIWDGRIWGGYRASDGWRKYSGGDSHSDHIHISLSWNGAMKRTSFWTGKQAKPDYGPCPTVEGALAPKYTAPRRTPCPVPAPVTNLPGTPVLERGTTGLYVTQLQKLLKVKPATGFFGPITDAALRRFQKGHHYPVTGRTDARTWAALRGGATPNPRSTSASGSPSYLTRIAVTVVRGDTLLGMAGYWHSSVSAIKAANHLKGDRIRRGQVLSIPVRSSLTRYMHVRLHTGVRSPTVTALQTALHMPKRYRTGYFGDITAGYVNTVKRHNGWKANAVVGPRLWRKLGA